MNAPIMPPPGLRRRAALPQHVRRLVGKLPRVPASAVAAAVLNLLVRRRLPVDVFERLGDRPFSIEVRDRDLVMAFRYRGRRFIAVPATGETALRFRVNASDIATLASPEDTPDGRFLRDLVVVGDPDIASRVHEVLRAIDVVRARRILRRAVSRVARELARA